MGKQKAENEKKGISNLVYRQDAADTRVLGVHIGIPTWAHHTLTPSKSSHSIRMNKRTIFWYLRIW